MSETTNTRFRIDRELGRSSLATVYLAFDDATDRRVALKVYAKSPLAPNDAEALRRLHWSTRLVAKLDDPLLPAVSALELDDEPPCVATRFVAGETLAARLESAGSPAPDTAKILRAVERAARALHAAHEAGVVHGNVKPENLVVTPAEKLVVLDLGLPSAGLAHESPFRSPEEREDGPAAIDRRSDVFALAVALMAWLGGDPPLVDSKTSLRGELRARLPRSVRTEWPELRHVFAAALAARPEHRFPTALAFADDLRRAHAGERVHGVRRVSWLARLRELMLGEPAVLAASVLVVAMLAFVVNQLAD